MTISLYKKIGTFFFTNGAVDEDQLGRLARSYINYFLTAEPVLSNVSCFTVIKVRLYVDDTIISRNDNVVFIIKLSLSMSYI